jgi:hypothetical protein
MLGEVLSKMCGTIDTSIEKRIFGMKCNAFASSLVLELANNFLHVAEVKIYGIGEC